MVYDFNAEEVFQMAEQIERNGARFYRRAAQNAQDAKSRELLEGLAAMEDEHEKTFIAMKKELTAPEREKTVFDPSGEGLLYLHALADTRVFFEKEIDITSMREILKAAMQAEKDSIVFYLGLKELVPDRLGKDRIEAIIKEEMGHIRIIGRELVAYG